ncbi:peptidase M17, partial [Micromonospora chalcea]
MLVIRLVSGPAGSDALVLPVRPGKPDSADSSGSPAELVPTAVAPGDDVRAEAAALLPATRLTGAAGEVREHLRP